MVEISVWVLPLIALVGALIPVFIWWGRDRADRRNQAIPPLADTRDLVDRLPPDSWAINANSNSLEKWEVIKGEWLKLRPKVVAIRGHYPKYEETAESICVTVDGLIVEVGWLVKAVLEHGDFREWQSKAKGSQARARADTNDLMRRIGK